MQVSALIPSKFYLVHLDPLFKTIEIIFHLDSLIYYIISHFYYCIISSILYPQSPNGPITNRKCSLRSGFIQSIDS